MPGRTPRAVGIALVLPFIALSGCRLLMGATALELVDGGVSGDEGGGGDDGASDGVSPPAAEGGDASSPDGDAAIDATQPDGDATLDAADGSDGGEQDTSDASETDVGDSEYVPPAASLSQLAIGFDNGAVGAWACALGGATGALHCWGGNDTSDILQQPDGGDASTPLTVYGVDGGAFKAAQVSGIDQAMCALAAGAVYCAGDPASHVLSGSNGPIGGVPVTLSGTVDQIAIGGSFGCAREKASLFCWGDDSEWSQLTSGFDGGSSTDVGTEIPALQGLLQVAAGHDHACAIMGGGSVECWGRNDTLQTGQISSDTCASNHPCVTTPAKVSGVSHVTQLALSFSHSCALDTSGQVYCWGKNEYMQLGVADAGAATCMDLTYGPPGQSVPCTASPSHVALGGPATYIAAGWDTTCAVVAPAGNVFCWGYDSQGLLGQLGPNSATPVEVALDAGYLSGAVQVALTKPYACALTTIGALYCWGFPDLNNGPASSGAFLVPW